MNIRVHHLPITKARINLGQVVRRVVRNKEYFILEKDGIPVAPDAYFALEDAKGRTNFFLEADRGTMTTKRFHLKLKAYAAYWREKKHHDKFDIKHFRVLTVTQSDQRQQ